jgi:hypothetical protein
MPRFTALALCALLPAAAQGASLKETELSNLLQTVARESSVGTPRAINEDILDQGYSAEGDELINHLSVRPAHAAQMRANPDAVRNQLTASVCGNPGFRRLLDRGARLRYQFTEYQTNEPIGNASFSKADCAR